MSSNNPDAGTSPVPSEGKQAEQKVMISSYTILIVITLLVGVATIALAQVLPGVTAASLSDILTSPISGFLDGIEVSLFLLLLGGCLGIVNRLGALDAGIAAQTFCLAAWERGVGTVITGYFDEEKITRLLNLPENQKVGCVIGLGYPDEEPAAPKRKSVEDLLTYK